MMARVARLIPFLAVVGACDGKGVVPAPMASPVSPSAVIASTSGDSTLSAGPMHAVHDVIVNILDACDAESFNNAGFGHLCDRSGGVKFDQFIAELTRFGFIGPWRFAGSGADVQVGQTFVATNRGGEVHTFTEVAEFGGGINSVLNELSRVPNVAPECSLAVLDPEDFVPPGGTYRETVSHSGNLKFQCCIHPWMRLEASSR
jgi:hypothetical protein